MPESCQKIDENLKSDFQNPVAMTQSTDTIKSNNPNLPNFDVLDMEQISKSVDLIYDKLFKVPRNDSKE